MKNKLLAVLFAAMMVLTTACGNAAGGAGAANLTAYQRLSAANEAYEEVTSMAMDFVMDMDIAMEGESVMNYVMSGDVRITDADKSDMKFAMVTNNDIYAMGQSQAFDMTAYYADGYYYLDMMGMSYKVSMPYEDALEQAAVISAADFEEQFVISETVDGNTLTFEVKGEAMTEFFEDAMGDMMASLGNASLTYGDVTYVAYLTDNNELEKMDMECSMDVTVEDETATATVKVSMTIKETGDSVTVDLPADLDSYEEMDASLLGL